MLRSLFLSFTLLFPLFCTAAPTTPFPHGCEVTGFGFTDQYLALNEKGEQAFYLLQNHSDQPIELSRYETQDVFMSPLLQSRLETGHWSAFASDIGNMYFKCTLPAVDENTPAVQVNCSEVLDVCQYPRAKFALSNMGNYWVSTNKPQDQVIKDATAKGIYLHW